MPFSLRKALSNKILISPTFYFSLHFLTLVQLVLFYFIFLLSSTLPLVQEEDTFFWL